MGYLAKTDHLDARVLSHFARTLHGSERCEQLLMRLPSIEQQELAALVARRAQVVQARVAERNRLTANQKHQHHHQGAGQGNQGVGCRHRP